MFWILSILLAALVVAAVIWPLARPGAPVGPARGRDLDVYAAQLAELETDLSRGAIGIEEAVSARAEIGRRILRAAGGERAEGPRTEPRRLITFALAFTLFAPLTALGVYAAVGSPQRPDMPLTARGTERPVGEEDFAALVAAAEDRLRLSPEDGRGWEVLAPVYAETGDLARAQSAYRQAIRLLGESARRLAGLGEVLVREAGGEVTDEARGLFRRATELEPGNPAPRLFLALDLTQNGRHAEAAEAWTRLLAEAPVNAPWRPMAEAALSEARGGPTSATVVEQAATVADEDRDAMIGGMVARLASRLEADPDDAEGWMRLVRAYGVLGDREQGEAALEQARRAFPVGTEEWANIADAGARAGFVVRTEPGR